MSHNKRFLSLGVLFLLPVVLFTALALFLGMKVAAATALLPAQLQLEPGALSVTRSLSSVTALLVSSSDSPLTWDSTWYPGGGYGNNSMIWGDVDGDGDLDLLAGTDNGIWSGLLYRNFDGTLVLDWDWQPGSTRTWSVAWGDVDGDGDLDLAVGNNGQPNQLHRNDGGTLTIKPVWTSTEADQTHSVAWGDVDGDGDLDLAVGSYGANRLYRNEGGTLTPNAVWSSTESAATLSVAWGDVDSDGDLDLAVGNDGQPNQLYRNDDGTLTFDATWMPDTRNTASVAWGDVDGDGDFDLAVGNNGQPNQLYRNQGGMLTLDTMWFPDGRPTRSVAWGDVDGDGDLDLAVGNNSEPSQLYRNNDGTLAFDATWTPDRHYANSVAWGDMDGDGDLDLVVGDESFSSQLYRNNSRDLALDTAWTHEMRYTSSVAWGDVDGDGDLDLAVGNRIGGWVYPYQLQLYRNLGGTLTLDLDWNPAESDTTSVAWGDVDGDGDLDLAVGNGEWISQTNHLYRNDNGTLTLAPVWASVARTTRSLAWGDVDGDGDLDLAVGNYGQSNQLYRNEDGTLMLDSAWMPDARTTRSVAWGDVDGDGDLDLAVGNYGQHNQLYRNDMGELTLLPNWDLDGYSTTSVAWGDVDGDGDLDLAIGNNESPNRLYRNDNGTLMLDPTWRPAPYATESVAWGDMDGDGDLDLAVGNSYHSDQLYRNDGGTLTLVTAWNSVSRNTTSLAWGDVDSDGDLDLAVGIESGSNQLYRNGGRGFSGLPNNSPALALRQPYDLPAANFYAMSGYLTDQHIPITYTIFDTDGESVGGLDAFYSPDGGGRWLPAVATTDTVTTHLRTGYWLNRAVLTPTQAISNTGISLSANMVISESTGSAEVATVEVWLWITHTNNADLSVTLQSPGGSQVPLFAAGQAGGQNFAHTRFSDASLTPITSSTAPYTATYRPLGDLDNFKGQTISGTWTLVITDSNTLAGTGVLAAWGLRIQTLPAVHTFVWDTFASGFFGQSDNVVFRLMARPQPACGAITGTYRYPNSTPGPFQRPYAVASTLPFRVRGMQVRVFSETATLSNTVSGALVYRLPAGQTGAATPFADSASKPFHTDVHGFLQGRGQLVPGDQLVALLPVTATNTYSLYHTSAAPNTTGLDAHTITTPGVQVLTVTAANPLLLFDLDISLEWDARNDGNFLEDLEYAVQQASAVLYDVSDGQAALGEVRLYHNKENWVSSDVVIYAQNGIRPRASMGGVADELTDDLGLTGVITNAYGPGQIRMGPNWDPFGQNLAELGVDWQRALAHELAHYLLYLPDNYLGVEDGIPVSIDCKGSFMTSTYDDAYSEFLTASGWVTPCTNSVAAHTTGRTDWETIQRFYAMLHQPGATNAGPSTLPLAVTHLAVVEPAAPAATFAPLFFDLRDAATQNLLPVPKAYGYLFKTQATGDITDDGVIALGATVGDGDRIKVRGAEAGDRLCIFGPYDETTRSAYAGCRDALSAADRSIPLTTVTDWQPVIIVQASTSRTLHITATLAVSESALHVQMFPAYGAPGEALVTAPTAAMQPVDATGHVFTQVLTLDAPTFEGFVRVWVPGAAPLREALTQFYLSPPWGPNDAGTGFNVDTRAWGANVRQLGAPVASGDGQVTIFNLEDIFADTGTVSLQALNDLPDLPAWFTVVGQGYRFVADAVFPRVLNFDYLQRDVPAGYEYTLAIYYRAEGDTTWQRLSTTVDTGYNRASAHMPDNAVNSQGLYALIATVELPPFAAGWNLFGYSIPETRPVMEALASLGSAYTSICAYDTHADVWRLYDRTVSPTFAWMVNDLTQLEFGRGYWLYATQPVTGYLGVPANRTLAVAGFQLPPATFYGEVVASPTFTQTAGMPVTAWINGVQCGSTTVVQNGAEWMYALQVAGEDLLNPGTCGAVGREVTFEAGGQPVGTAWPWHNRQAWYYPLSDRTVIFTETQTLTGPGNYTFGDACAQLTFADGNSLGALTAVTITQVYTFPTAQADPKSLPRTYRITGNVSAGFTATLSLCYDEGDLLRAGVPFTAETDLQVYRYIADGLWDAYPSTVDAAANRVATTLTGFSTWTVGAPTGAHTPNIVHVYNLRYTLPYLGLLGGFLLGCGWWYTRKRLKVNKK